MAEQEGNREEPRRAEPEGSREEPEGNRADLGTAAAGGTQA